MPQSGGQAPRGDTVGAYRSRGIGTCTGSDSPLTRFLAVALSGQVLPAARVTRFVAPRAQWDVVSPGRGVAGGYRPLQRVMKRRIGRVAVDKAEVEERLHLASQIGVDVSELTPYLAVAARNMLQLVGRHFYHHQLPAPWKQERCPLATCHPACSIPGIRLHSIFWQDGRR